MRSQTKAIRVPSGDSVGAQLPQASTQASLAASGGHRRRRARRRSRHAQPTPWSCSHISSSATCHSALEPSVVRVVFGSASRRSHRVGPEQPAPPGGRVGQRVAHPVEERALQVPDGGHREVALGPVDDLVGHDAAGGALEHALAAVGELELGRDPAGQLDELVVEERHPRLEPPGHRHVVDPLHRVVDQHHRGVAAQRGVDRGLGARRGEVLGDERASARRGRPASRGDRSVAHRRPAPVEEHVRVRLDGVLARHAGQRRVPVVPAEHLVGALAGLHDLDALDTSSVSR